MIEVQSRPAYTPAGTVANANNAAQMTAGQLFTQAENLGSPYTATTPDGIGAAGWFGPIPAPQPGLSGVPGTPGTPWPGAGYGGGGQGNQPISSILQQLMGLLGSLLGALGFGGGGSIGSGQNNPQQFFSNATASSQGDPHLSFSGTTGSGTPVNNTWDNMNSHPYLLRSDSFAGGYQIGSTVTPAAANGTTMNQQASVTTDGGATVVSMDNTGHIGIMQNGSQLSIAAGQTVALGNGESVTENSDGSLTINDTAYNGGTIATTLSASGGGVNISTAANDVFLGGYMARTSDGGPVMSPYDQMAHPLVTN